MSDLNTSLGHDDMAWEPNSLATELQAQKKYKCPQCPSSFKRPENLKRHQRGHDEHRRFTCQICDKSFARSSYPEEPRLEMATPHAWSSATSISDGYNTIGVGSLGSESPSEALRTRLRRDAFPQYLESLEWETGGPPVPYGELSIAPPSDVPQTGLYTYLGDHHENHFASFSGYDAVSPQGNGLHAGLTGDIIMDDMGFMTSDIESGKLLGAYDQTADMPSGLMPRSSRKNHDQPIQTDGSHYTYRLPMDGEPLDASYDTYDTHSSSPAYFDMLGQSETWDFSSTVASHENSPSAQASAVDVDVDAHFMAPTFTNPGLGKDYIVPFDATPAGSGASQHNHFMRMHLENFGHYEDSGSSAESGDINTFYENSYSQL
ncbi:hypothetical protein NUW58_g6219 [Xylaria curta]|uniref:Uncharacterized protein n=1 Tax=Xylaria curta TaxID=42375 RepID=A0ACC1NWG0_9PEZI|nr:hypothetical protein NUW58_g6219 [Xylaria curta]